MTTTTINSLSSLKRVKNHHLSFSEQASSLHGCGVFGDWRLLLGDHKSLLSLLSHLGVAMGVKNISKIRLNVVFFFFLLLDMTQKHISTIYKHMSCRTIKETHDLFAILILSKNSNLLTMYNHVCLYT